VRVQNYEDYWKLTLEYTNIHSDKFIGTLSIIVNCIDNNFNYTQLQNAVYQQYPKVDMGSVRKSINQFVKLGFINSITSYNTETIDFLNAKTNRKRNSIFSKIVYKYSKFNASITNTHNWNQINFLIKTLEEVGTLSRRNIIGLMLVDIPHILKGYLTQTEVNYYTALARKIGFIRRKYNQVGYLFNLLNKLDDIVFVNNILYFEDDARVIFGDSLRQNVKKRDNYLHRIYKNLLKDEVEENLGYTQCMVENLSYPSLVASHIKPFIKSDDNEAYDPNNGLLLSRNFDILFDQGYITFDNLGKIICSRELNQDVINHISNYKLEPIFINPKRLYYLEFHQNNIFKN
jgi:hypothetical protein